MLTIYGTDLLKVHAMNTPSYFDVKTPLSKLLFYFILTNTPFLIFSENKTNKQKKLFIKFINISDQIKRRQNSKGKKKIGCLKSLSCFFVPCGILNSMFNIYSTNKDKAYAEKFKK